MKKRWMVAPIASGILAIGGLAAVAYGEPGKLIPVDPEALEPVEAVEQPVSSDQAGAGAAVERGDDREHATISPNTSEESGTSQEQAPVAAEPVPSAEAGHESVVHATAERATASGTLISRSEAVRIAISQTGPSVRVTEVELDQDDGRTIYEIELEGGPFEYELEIDAETGEVLDFEKDD